MIVKVENITKAFGEHVILKDFSLDIEENSFTIIYGESGCGKSTLLNIIGLLEPINEGHIELFHQRDVQPFSKKAEKLLRDKIGYLFQNFALEDEETVETNLKIVLENRKIKKEVQKQMIHDALCKVGLENYEKKKIFECSGGEQQRIAIARLLLKPCELILADEPTGNLDEKNKHIVFSLLKELQDQGKTLVVVTHDPELKEIGDHVLYL